MEITKIDTTKNPLLSRTEATAHLMFNGVTPSNADVQKGIATKLGAEEANVVVKKIDASYGGGKATAHAFVYESADAKTAVEPRVKEKKK